jgi:hypothetical protein
MSGFLYLIPGSTQKSSEEIRATEGLGAVIGSSSFSIGMINGGPEGTTGTLVAIEPVGELLVGYYPDKQTWMRVKKAGQTQYWMGWQNDQKPTEPDLRRPNKMGGHEVVFEDGNRWEVPTIGPMLMRSHLPCRFVFGEDGEAVDMQVVERYQPIFEKSRAVWNFIFNEASEILTWGDMVNYVGEVLSINYRVGRPELLAMGWLTKESAYLVMEASVGLPAILAEKKAQDEAQKKMSG